MLTLAATAAACGPKTPTTSQPPPGGSGNAGADPGRPVLTAAASALDKRDGTQFAATLSTPLRQTLGDRLDLSGPGAAGLARALRDARLVAEYDAVRVYETKVDGETFSFLMVKEDGQWLLAGL